MHNLDNEKEPSDIDVNKNIGDKDVQVLDINDIPVVIQAENNIATDNYSKLYIYISHSYEAK